MSDLVLLPHHLHPSTLAYILIAVTLAPGLRTLNATPQDIILKMKPSYSIANMKGVGVQAHMGSTDMINARSTIGRFMK